MTSSATSTEKPSAARASESSSFQAWHFFVLLSMVGATVVVMVSRDTHPVALLLLSAAVVGAGLVGVAIQRAVTGFFAAGREDEPVAASSRDALIREKALVLRSIKELEFDRAMGKVGDADFAAISAGLRARAITLMKDIDRGTAPEPKPAQPSRTVCRQCGLKNDADARFCKQCGTPLQPESAEDVRK